MVLSAGHFVSAFPFKGNWNSIGESEPRHECMHFVSAFPFEGNWNENTSMTSRSWSDQNFVSAFPFEGNWNAISFAWCFTGTLIFVSAFPFEGNWNGVLDDPVVCSTYSLSMLSRLKGIETLLRMSVFVVPVMHLCLCFPVWRELKPMTLAVQYQFKIDSLSMLSRLKGIETRKHRQHTQVA